MGIKKYDWNAEIQLWMEKSEEDSELSMKAFCQERKLDYFEFCRQWAHSPNYAPRYARDKRFIGEGFKSTDNLILDEKTIKAIQFLKCFVSPIRLEIVRYLSLKQNTVLEFMKKYSFAWFTTHQAFKHLERMGIIEVIGKQESFNVYRLKRAESVKMLLASIEELA